MVNVSGNDFSLASPVSALKPLNLLRTTGPEIKTNATPLLKITQNGN